MVLLCRRRHEKINVLAAEFNVSPRTIERDIAILSLDEPIYTQCGKYDGGVYIDECFTLNRVYMTDMEIEVLEKLYDQAVNSQVLLTSVEQNTLYTIISEYSKPKINKM